MKIDNIDFRTSLKILNFLKEKKWVEQDFQKNVFFALTDQAEKGFIFRPPPCINLKMITWKEDDNIPDYILLLIQAGYAAIARTAKGEIVDSKLIRRYMVRKKQGKAQIAYLKTKGKSRVGSRIRLKESMLFFEDINSILNEYSRKDLSVLYSCTPLLWGMLFDSKIPAPFEKKADNWLKIPFHVNRPDQKELSRINFKCQQGSLEIINEKMHFIINEINQLT